MSSVTMEVDDNDSTLNDEFALSTTFTSGETGVRAAGVCHTTSSAATGTSTTLVVGDQLGGLAAFDLHTREMALLEPQSHTITALLTHESECVNVYVTGCKDNVIRIYNASTHALVKELKGHDRPVTSLAWATATTVPDADAATDTETETVSEQLFLISGSWDGTARIWNMVNHALVATLPDHENSVCVVGLPPPPSSSSSQTLRVATGSAGVAENGVICKHAIRLWSIQPLTGQVTLENHIPQDHEGPIRGLCNIASSLPSSFFASCSNDGTVKVRDNTTGQVLSTLSFVQQQQQHPPMLLSVTSFTNTNPSNNEQETIVVAGAEDGHVIVWNLTKLTTHNQQIQPQILLHASCVWNVVPLPNGDFGTCCQDGHFYVFTRAPARMADASTRTAWAESVASAQQKLHSGPSNDEITKLPHWTSNSTIRGRSEGQVQLFQRDGIAIAAQWSAASQTWIEVGQVVGGGAGNQDQGILDGVRYDHILPIQVDTAAGGGTVNLQIGYNNGENPFVAAQRFIDAHVLPQYHLADIADYIQQRVGSAAAHTLGGGGSGSASAGLVRPAVATTGVPLAAYVHLPAKTYKTFDLPEKTAPATLEKMKTKLESFQLLSTDQLATLASLMETLVATNRYHASQVSDAELQLIAHMLEHYSLAQCFPALDLARMMVLHPDAASKARSHYWSTILQLVTTLHTRMMLVSAGATGETPELDSTTRVAIPMLSLRLFANAFKGGPGSLEAVSSRLEDVMAIVKHHVASSNKNIRLSVATVLHNLCFYLHSSTSSSSSFDLILDILTQCRDILANRAYEGEAIQRTLVAIGTLIMTPSSNSPAATNNNVGQMAKEAASSLFLASKVEMAASPHGPSVKAAAKEVYTILA